MKRLFLLLVCFSSFPLFAQQGLIVTIDTMTGYKGAINERGDVIIPAEYEELVPDGSYIVFVKNSKVGIMDGYGRIVVPNDYGYGIYLEEEYDVVWAEKQGKRGMIDFENNIILPFIYDDCYLSVKEDLIRVCKNEKYGLVSFSQRKEIVPCVYDEIEMGEVLYDNGIITIYNPSPSPLIAAMKEGKCGFIDCTGKTVIPFVYDDPKERVVELNVFQYGVAPVLKGGKVCLINTKGKELTAAKYNRMSIHRYKPYVRAKMDGGGVMLLDYNGTELTKEYDDLDVLSGGWYTSRRHGEYGSESLGSETYELHDRIVTFKRNNLWGVLDIKGKKETVPAKYEELEEGCEGFLIFKKNGKYGYVSCNGEEQFHGDLFDAAEPFVNGFAAVRKDGKYGCVKANGYYGLYMDCLYDEEFFFDKNGFAIVKKDGKYGVITSMKKTVIPIEYTGLGRDEDLPGCFIVAKNGKIGILDNRGKVLMPLQFTEETFPEEIEKFKKSRESVVKPVVDPGTDVDTGIPIANQKDKDLYVLIIANGNYYYGDGVSTAIHDGEIVREYCIKTLGAQPDHVVFVQDADNVTMSDRIESFISIIERHRENGRFLLFYFGHGAPSLDRSVADAYLIPINLSQGSNMQRHAISRNDLMHRLQAAKPNQMVVCLEACFNGGTNEGGGKHVYTQQNTSAPMLEDDVDATSFSGNIVLLTASSGSQSAHAMPGGAHNVFTYQMLKKLQESGGNITWGELFGQVRIATQDYSQLKMKHTKAQTPTCVPSRTLGDNWKTWKVTGK